MTGEVGCGKTTVCRHVTAGLHPGQYRVYCLSLSTGNVLDMYKAIAWEWGLPTERSRATAYRAIRDELTRLVQEAKQLPVLIVDEAQHLRNDVLEDLRLLTSYAMDAENRLCLLLVGLTELRRRLSMAVHESLSQRLVVRHHLPGLGRDELDAYLTHRLRLAGAEATIFLRRPSRPCSRPLAGCPARSIVSPAHYALAAASPRQPAPGQRDPPADRARRTATVNRTRPAMNLDDLPPCSYRLIYQMRPSSRSSNSLTN